MHTKKPLSILLTICIILGLLPWTVLPVRADYVTVTEPIYINSSNKSQYDGKLLTGTFSPLETDSCFANGPLNNGYWNGAIIIDGVTIDLRIQDLVVYIHGTKDSGRNISGIYLANGATLNLKLDGSSNSSNIIKACGDGAGICVTNGCTLNITSLATNGKLTVYGGCSRDGDTDTASEGGAGIGAEGANNTGLGTINIISGTIEAYGGLTGTATAIGAAAIGGSYSSGSTGAITISGGTVNATAYYGNAAIGGAYGHAVESITISGGTVTANVPTSLPRGASIGCGASDSTQNKLSCGTISITGGTVTTNGNIGYGDGGPGTGYSGGSLTIGENATINCSGSIAGGDHTYHKISFDANGGTGSKKPIYVAEDSYTLPSCSFTAPSGYSFNRWNLGKAGATVQIIDDTVLQAQWEKDVTVHFDPGRGSGTMTDYVGNYEEQYTLPSCTFTPPQGESFLYWQKENNWNVII